MRRDLVVQTSDDVLARARLIVLYKIHLDADRLACRTVPCFEQVTAFVFVHGRLEEQHLGQVGRSDLQLKILSDTTRNKYSPSYNFV